MCRPAGRALCGLAAAALLLPATAVPVRATGPDFASRALPAVLLVDETNLLRLPAGARYFTPRILIQAGRGASSVFNPVTGDFTRAKQFGNNGPFGMVTGGSRNRVAYVFSNGTHGFLFAPGSFGFSLTYTESLDDTEDLQFRFRGNNEEDEYLRHARSTRLRREVRLGVGALVETATGRIFEAGVGASWLDAGQQAYAEDLDGNRTATGWEEKGIRRGDVLLRTLHPDRGLQLVVGYAHMEMDPDAGAAFLPVEERAQSASLDVAWRQPTSGVQDLVVGGAGRWSFTETGRFYASTGTSSQRQGSSKTLDVVLFASVEKEIVEHLLLRGGVMGGAERRRDESVEIRFDTDSDILEYWVDGDRDKRWNLTSPAVRLGLGWTWKGFTTDVQFDQELDLSTLVASWSISHPL